MSTLSEAIVSEYRAAHVGGRPSRYAFIFDQKGLMAGLGLQGSKITKLDK